MPSQSPRWSRDADIINNEGMVNRVTVIYPEFTRFQQFKIIMNKTGFLLGSMARTHLWFLHPGQVISAFGKFEEGFMRAMMMTPQAILEVEPDEYLDEVYPVPVDTWYVEPQVGRYIRR